jgi:hypothetical protein
MMTSRGVSPISIRDPQGPAVIVDPYSAGAMLVIFRIARPSRVVSLDLGVAVLASP